MTLVETVCQLSLQSVFWFLRFRDQWRFRRQSVDFGSNRYYVDVTLSMGIIYVP